MSNFWGAVQHRAPFSFPCGRMIHRSERYAPSRPEYNKIYELHLLNRRPETNGNQATPI